MADETILNDEQALSIAEQLVREYRGVQHLHALTQHLRDARKDLPVLNETLAALRAEQATAIEATAAVKAQREREQAEYDTWAAEMAASRKALAAEVANERDGLSKGLAALRLEAGALTTQRDELRADVAKLEAAVQAESARLAALKDEHRGVAGVLADLKAELAALRKKHGL